MGTIFRATTALIETVRRDLQRPHRFAFERVGFLTVKAAAGLYDLVLLAQGYFPVEDSDYVPDPTVGAMMGSNAIRKAMDMALLDGVGIFHVHMHLHPGKLWFSPLDLREQLKFVPDFFNVSENMPHGAIVLSPTEARGRVWFASDDIGPINEFNFVGSTVAIRRSPPGVDFEA